MDLKAPTGQFTVIDHTEQRWQYRYRKHGRENGASTYSKDIIEHHVPVWAEALEGRDVVLSSCPRLLNMPDLTGNVAVQYLHEYRYDSPLKSVKMIQGQMKHQFGRVIFVTAYKSLAAQINAAGLEAVFVPMAIDTQRIVPANLMTPKGPKVAAYFGNILGAKQSLFKDLRKTFSESGWALEHVAGPQYTAWQDLTQYQFGVGVGRCAQEMMHLGLKVMIAGSQFGGLITNDSEWLAQRDTNFNGRVVTFDRDPVACLNAWEESISHRAYDVREAVTLLEESLPALGL